MSQNWSTKENDIEIAKKIMQNHIGESETSALGLFEIVVNIPQKKMDFRLAKWVVNLAKQFHALYGSKLGLDITKKVIADCMVNGETRH